MVVGCGKAVYGPVGNLHRRGEGTLTAGPVAWPALRQNTPQSPAAYQPHDGLARFLKLLILVKDGAPTTLTVPTSERSRLAFHYGTFGQPRSTWHGFLWFRLSDGSSAVTFKPCPLAKTSDGWTQFPGGFIVRGAQCATVNITHERTRLHPQISLGQLCR